jgi:HlyD family secretion protein
MANLMGSRGIRRGRWLGAGIVLIVVMIIIAVLVNSAQSRAAASVPDPTVPVTRGNIVADVAGSGTVAAAQSLDQVFQTNGTVVEVLVEEGDTVTKGQVLARIDPRALQLKVDRATVALKSARAQYAQAEKGNATPEDLAAAQASVDSSEANLFKARNGNVTTADIQNAEAQVNSARAQLQKTKTGNITTADIQNAEAQVRAAEAQVRKATTGNVTAADIENAEAQVRAAQAQLDKARSGGVTPSDIANAEAQVRSAQAQLDKVMQGATPDQLSSAQANLDQAKQSYQKTADAAAANKVQAEQSMLQAADSVRLAQEAYSTAYWNNQQAQSGRNPQTGHSFDDDRLDAGVQQQQYASALRDAELQLSQAQSRLEQAKTTYENAKQQEITDLATAQIQVDNAQVQLNELLKGPNQSDVTVAQSQLDQARANLEKLQSGGSASDIAAAQAQLDQANANLKKLKQGGTPADIAAAQAQLDQANANLTKLRQGGTANDIAISQAQLDQAQANLQKLTESGTEADIAAAQAQVDQAQANYDKLTAEGTLTDLEIRQAQVDQAAQDLEQAKYDLEAVTLKAPFTGVVTAVNIVPGSVVGSTAAAVTIVDRSTLHVDLRLSENDVVRAKLGQPVAVTIDSLSGWQTTGEIDYIAPAAEVTNDVVTYGVRVSFVDDDPSVKVGMTANLNITTAIKENILLVPNSALLPKGAGRVVQVPNADGTVREVDVQVGLTDGTQTEIVSGLKEGDRIIALPGTSNPRAGRFGG